MSDSIDDLLDSLERMIDAQDDMWEEEKYSNYREVMSIKESRYIPAKQATRDGLRKVITEIVRQEIAKQSKSKNWGTL